MIKIPRQKDYLKPFGRAAAGLAGVGIATAVGAGVMARGSPNASVMGGFKTLAGFTPIAVTAVSAKSVLGMLKKKRKR